MRIFTMLTLILLTNTTIAQKSNDQYYLSISHEIQDFDEWKLVFDKFESDRQEAGISKIFVKKDLENIKSVTIFSSIVEIEKAQEFMSSPKLKKAMTEAGVISAPDIIFYKSSNKFAPINSTDLVTTIAHSVKDFAIWKHTYEAAEEIRKKAGITDNLLLLSLTDSNEVTVLGSAKSKEDFEQFMSNPELRETMKKAGVTSKPNVKILL